jgi:hypothetical protein
MKLSKQQLTLATTLPLHTLKKAIEAGGYSSRGIMCAQFAGLNTDTGQFIYSFEYQSDIGELESGWVYITAYEDQLGKISFVGDF